MVYAVLVKVFVNKLNADKSATKGEICNLPSKSLRMSATIKFAR
jgi:hypothetical protein